MAATWTWTNFVMYTERFDTDDVPHRLTKAAAIIETAATSAVAPTGAGPVPRLGAPLGIGEVPVQCLILQSRSLPRLSVPTMKRPKLLPVVLMVVAVAFWPSPAFAHEVPVAVVLGDRDGDARSGFDLAVDESPDVSHPPGEGGDHLGGVDVDISYLPASDLAALGAAIGSGTRVVAVVADAQVAGAVAAVPGIDGALVTVAAGTAVPARPGWIVLVDAAAGQSALEGFRSRFRAAYGREPSPEAARGYDVARLLDAAIASAGETLGPSDARSIVPESGVLSATAVLDARGDSTNGTGATEGSPSTVRTVALLALLTAGAVAVAVAVALRARRSRARGL